MILRVDIKNQELLVNKIVAISQEAGLQWTKQQYVDDLLKENTIYLVSEAGFIASSYIFDEAEITNIAVYAASKGTGEALSLWQALKQVFDEKGIVTCFLEVRKSNWRAKRFYEKVGFEKIGERKKYYHHPLEDALIYRWENK